KRRRHFVEYLIVPSFRSVFVTHKARGAEIEFLILDLVLASAPAQLVSPEPVVIAGCPAKMQLVDPAFRIKRYPLPHHQVVAPQLIAGRVRSAKFVNRLFSPMEKHRTRYRFTLAPRNQ